MEGEPLVTVIITFLNAGKFLVEAAESVLAQTYQNWELILVDDGSSDESTRIALDYSSRHPGKIFYLAHEGYVNKGISASRNLGAAAARGEYIATLDADDKWTDNKLEHQIAIFRRYKDAAMVYGTTRYWYSWTGDRRDLDRDFTLDLMIPTGKLYEPPLLLKLALESKTVTASMSCIMFKRSLLQSSGGFEESFKGMHEDQAFLAKIYTSYPVYVSGECWDFYRQHPNSLSSIAGKDGQLYSSELNYLGWLERYLLKTGDRDQELLKALEQRKWQYRYTRLSAARNSYNNYRQKVVHLLKRMIGRLPSFMKYFISRQLRGTNYRPPTGFVDFGVLRRLNPVSECWGEDRGLPVDRYYIEKFLSEKSEYIKGSVLEIGDDRYTRKYGGDAVTKNDILNLDKDANPGTTIEADLTSAHHIPPDSFDCIIFAQTLQLIYDIRSTMDTLYRILKPGGVLLATVSGISQTTDDQWWDRNWCWRFTSVSVQKIFQEKFPSENIEVKGYGNVLVAASFLYGLSKDDLRQEELNYFDHRYEILIAVKAVKPG